MEGRLRKEMERGETAEGRKYGRLRREKEVWKVAKGVCRSKGVRLSKDEVEGGWGAVEGDGGRRECFEAKSKTRWVK